MAKRNELTQLQKIDPLENISGVALEMEEQISDATAIARTLKQRCNDAENEGEEVSCGEALGLILYRLEQIQEGHALIVKNVSYRDYVPGEKGGLS